jgi:ABC-type sugar transport system substrate-binding protein
MGSKRKVLGGVAALVALAAIPTVLMGGIANGATKAVPSWCGPKKISLSLSDGFGGNNWRRITRGEAQDEASKCPNVTKFVYTDGQANLQKSISDIQGLAAQGIDAMVVFPDQSDAVLPAIRSAYKAGHVVVPYRVFPGGKAGTDYDYYIKTDFSYDGTLMAKWVAKALHGKGNVVYLGGPAGNSQSRTRSAAFQAVFKKYPGIHFIGQKPFEVTNWDPALTQKVVTAALAKYPKIDAFMTDFGAAFASSLAAFQQAHRKVPAVAAEDSNAFGCAAKKSGFPTMTVSSQNWMVRTAVDFAVAKASGGKIPASDTVKNTMFDDSLNKKVGVHCDPSLPGDAILSTHLAKAKLKAALG